MSLCKCAFTLVACELCITSDALPSLTEFIFVAIKIIYEWLRNNLDKTLDKNISK